MKKMQISLWFLGLITVALTSGSCGKDSRTPTPPGPAIMMSGAATNATGTLTAVVKSNTDFTVDHYTAQFTPQLSGAFSVGLTPVAGTVMILVFEDQNGSGVYESFEKAAMVCDLNLVAGYHIGQSFALSNATNWTTGWNSCSTMLNTVMPTLSAISLDKTTVTLNPATPFNLTVNTTNSPVAIDTVTGNFAPTSVVYYAYLNPLPVCLVAPCQGVLSIQGNTADFQAGTVADTYVPSISLVSGQYRVVYEGATITKDKYVYMVSYNNVQIQFGTYDLPLQLLTVN